MATRIRDSGGRFTGESIDAAVFAKDIEGFILGSTAVHEAKMALAERVKDYWQSVAPEWGDRDPKGRKPPTINGNEPGDYRESIQVFHDEDGVVYVGSDHAPLADWIEWGCEHMPEYGPGARTLAHFGGGHVDPKDKTTNTLFIG